MGKSTFDTIKISPELAEQFAAQIFGLHGTCTPLTGEVDFNFRLKVGKKDFYTLKVSRPQIVEVEIDFQTAITQHLAAKEIPFAIPEVVNSLNGKAYETIIDEQGETRWVRLQKWISGRVIDELNPKTKDIFHQWGATCGHLSKALKDFDHPGAHRIFRWDPSQLLDTRKLEQYLASEEDREIANYFWNLFEKQTLPILAELRKSVNYNDAHELNLLVNTHPQDIKIEGLIDFGDAVYTHTINELAIACAYAAMDQADPLEVCASLVEAYHQVFPLEEKEIEVLYSLICARLLISASYSAFNRFNEPENEYLQISDQRAWNLLRYFRKIAPALAHYYFRSACGIEPCPQKQRFETWAPKNKASFYPLIKLEGRKICPLDLSIGGVVLGNNEHFSTAEKMKKRIFRYLEDQKADLGVGGYLETRPFYSTDAFQQIGNNGPQWRTVHTGLDLWSEAGTPIFAPLDAKVHSFNNNAAERDYGPAIILEHQVDAGFSFYTLYGHLSLDSLDGLAIGQAIKKGQAFAKIGAAPENGNWAPHLHFQIILDMLGMEGDFPGVAYPHEVPIWASLSPDPALLIPESLPRANVRLPKQENILSKRTAILGKGLSISYQQPLYILRGFKQYLYDINGRRYLDTVNNVAHVGHEHPEVVKAAQGQIGLLNTNTRYLHQELIAYAEELLAHFPPELSVVHFVNSGSEANELAMRMVETLTGSREMIAIEVGYHGNTGRAIDVSSYKFDGKGGKGAPEYTQIVPIPDVYRGLYGPGEQAGENYARHVGQAIENIKARGKKVGGFIGESILSCGGQIVLPEGYLAAVYKQVRAAGGLCISDEVQVGFGRVGEHFWGFQLQDVIPDIVTLGKPIGNGHPMGAVVTTPAIATAFANGMEFFSTFGGNPVSCTIGRAVLKVIKEEALQDNALKQGQYMMDGLKKLMQKYPVIGDVRGHGLFFGFELIKNSKLKTPAPELATYIANRMRSYGILMSTDGPFYNVIKSKPPMCFDRDNAAFVLHYLEKVLQEDFVKWSFEY